MKSTFDQAHTIYRHAQSLSRAHKIKVIGWLTEDVSGVPVKPIRKAAKKPEQPAS